MTEQHTAHQSFVRQRTSPYLFQHRIPPGLVRLGEEGACARTHENKPIL